MPKSKFYVVWKGRKTGIFTTWVECSAQVNGFVGARYKSFADRAAAEKAWAAPAGLSLFPRAARSAPASQPALLGGAGPIADSFSVDAACAGNPGVLEYRCLHTTTWKEIFHEGPFPNGTNNIGEFLAVVQALQILQAQHSVRPIYSDSKIALSWVRKKKCKTTLRPNRKNTGLFERIQQAEDWLRQNNPSNPMLKWDTAAWGEIPADFGRK